MQGEKYLQGMLTRIILISKRCQIWHMKLLILDTIVSIFESINKDATYGYDDDDEMSE